jgi:hypothetical protein
MSRWFRMYDDVLNDPKAQKLSDADFRGWVNLMCLASKHDGRLDHPVGDIAFALRKTAAKTLALLTALQSAGLVDGTETGWKPHNWEQRQYKSDVSTARVKRFRKQAGAVSETPPESEAESETESERKDSSGPPADADNPAPSVRVKGKKIYPPAFEAFWRDYPTDALMSKSKAFEKWARLGAEDRAAAHASLPAFRAHCARDLTYRPVHAERFLAQRRFDGFIEQAAAAATPQEDAGLRALWGGQAEALVDAIGTAKFQAWFADTAMEAGVLKVPRAFAANWIAGHYAGDLRRLYGDVKIEVEK